MRRIAWKRRPESFGRLRALSAWELLQAQQEALLLTPSDSGLGLCLNACVLARAIVRGRTPVFSGGEAVLSALTEAQIRQLCERYLTRFSGGETTHTAMAVNPAFDEARFEELRRQ